MFTSTCRNIIVLATIAALIFTFGSVPIKCTEEEGYNNNNVAHNGRYGDYSMEMFKFCHMYFLDNHITSVNDLNNDVKFCRHYLTKDYIRFMKQIANNF